MGTSAVTHTLLLALVVVAIGALSGATTGQRQVGGFFAEVTAPSSWRAASVTSQTGHRRYISIKPGMPITAALEPGDHVVEVVLDDFPTFINLADTMDRDDPEETIASFLHFMTAVAVIKVTKKESTFTSFYPPGEFHTPDSWITSTLTAEVQSVLKDVTGRLVEGRLIEVEESGGEMVLNDGRRIIARYGRTRLTRVGGTYLALLDLDRERRFTFDRESSLEFTNGQIKRLRLDKRTGSGLEQKTPEWVVERGRAEAEWRKR